MSIARKQPAPAGPDFTLTNHGSIMVLDANTGAAQAWVAEHLAHPETQTWGRNGTVIEPRYWSDIAGGIEADGLVIA
jgi:hypothetical protein